METEAIKKLLSQYCQKLDDAQHDQLEDLLTKDAHLIISAHGIDVTGGREICSTYRAMTPPGSKGLHCLLNPIIDVDGEYATAVVDNLWINLRDKPEIGAAGRYVCNLAKTEGLWKIQKLEVLSR